MRNYEHAQADIDYAAYLVQIGCCTLEEALSTCGLSGKTLQEYFPGLMQAPSPGDRSLSFSAPKESTDYFVFYQDDGKWAWQRVNQSETVVEVSGGSFRLYAHCTADAKRRGWPGTALSLFL